MNYPNIIKVTALDNYQLSLKYEASEERIFDVTPYIKGCWYGELKNMDYFKAVRAVGDTVEWPDGQDLAPHELYENSVPVAKYP